MKSFLIKWIIDLAFDEILKALEKLANRSDSSVDNDMVALIADNKDAIIEDIKNSI